MLSDTVILKQDCDARARAQMFSRGQHCYASMQTDASLLRYASTVTEQWKCGDLLRQSLIGFKLYATSANIVVAPCTEMTQPVGPKNVARCWPTMLRPFAWALFPLLNLPPILPITKIIN